MSKFMFILSLYSSVCFANQSVLKLLSNACATNMQEVIRRNGESISILSLATQLMRETEPSLQAYGRFIMRQNFLHWQISGKEKEVEVNAWRTDVAETAAKYGGWWLPLAFQQKHIPYKVTDHHFYRGFFAYAPVKAETLINNPEYLSQQVKEDNFLIFGLSLLIKSPLELSQVLVLRQLQQIKSLHPQTDLSLHTFLELTAASPMKDRLERFDFSSIRVANRDVNDAIDMLKEFPNLVNISFENLPLNDESLGKIARFKNLRYVKISDKNLSDKAKAELKKALPKAEVIFMTAA